MSNWAMLSEVEKVFVVASVPVALFFVFVILASGGWLDD